MKPRGNSRSRSTFSIRVDVTRRRFIRDGEDADWKTRADSIVIESRDVKRGDTLDVALAPGGGQAIRFVPEIK